MIDSTYVSIPASVPTHVVPDWARFLSNLDAPAVGEAAEERAHHEIALNMKLVELAANKPELARMAKLFIEYGANVARLIPSPTDQLNALGGFVVEDHSWSMCVSIPYTVDGNRMLTMIRRVCGLDEWLWSDMGAEVPFSVTGRVTEDKVAFIMTGYGDEALNLLSAGLDSLNAPNHQW